MTSHNGQDKMPEINHVTTDRYIKNSQVKNL